MKALYLTAAQIAGAIFIPWALGKWIGIVVFDAPKMPSVLAWTIGTLIGIVSGILCVALYELYKFNRTIIKG